YTNSARTGSDHGGGNRWSTTWAAVKSSARTDYEAAKKMIDVENLADYMLLNFYAGNTWDWSEQHNWMAGGPRDPDRGGWKFYCWDSDIILQDVRNNPIPMNVPDGLFQQLLKFDDFRVMFRDRVYKHCFNNGALTPEKVAASYNYRMEEIFLPIVAETARWQPTAATRLPWDRDGEWTTEWNHFRGIWFPQRTGILLDQLRTTRLRGASLYPIDTPEFRQRGGNVNPGYVPSLTAEEGTIYYTIDGSDPRLPGGKISPTAKAFAGGRVPVTFVERGAEWRFHDSGENLGVAWRNPGYDDSQWSSGRGQLGYGERDETTVVSTGPDPFLKNPTTYFRRNFDVADAAAVTDLNLELLRDDGAVVYLNGTEILRDDMPEGAITFDSLAVDGASGSSESTFFSFELPLGAIVTGRNVLAVEIHQESVGSSDMSFDLGLTGRRLSGAADLTINAPTFVRMRALDDDEWSGINEAWFTLTGTATASADNVIISEIHYNPSGDDGSAAEFIELHNTTGSPMDLSNVEITGAVKFVFPAGIVVPAKGVIVVTSDTARFATIYPNASALIAGQWDGSLSNGGERIKINASDGTAILNFKYGDGNRWPNGADGGGSSVELSDIAAAPTGFAERSAWLENPDHWQASSILNGSPGAIPGAETTAYDDWVTDTFPQDASPVEVAPDADYDGDGNSNFIEFAFVRNATVPDSSAILTITTSQNGTVAIAFPVRSVASGVRYSPQWSSDLQLWQDGTVAIDSVVDKLGDDGTTTRTLTIRPGEPVSAFFRVEVR
ncbi:MAG: lamin tail domain-containing protein, partial [Verrucomicrobia bacterium]|nr:lamin tail domain-containing protein [Verrucomicrobiota bacterium]